MRNDNLDKQIKQLLNKQTEAAVERKQETWNKISNELDALTYNKRAYKRKNQGRGLAIAGLSAAIIAFLLFGAMTDTGQAMIQNLKDIFIGEKEEEIDLEGQKEDTNVQLETNEELRYVIYIDQDRYKMVEGETADRIETIEPFGDEYPEVYMEITHVENTTTEEAIANIIERIENDEEMELYMEERTTEPIEAEMVQAMGLEYTNEFGKFGYQWDTPIHRYYVTDEDDGSVFIIKLVYFVEAEEGHGARFHYMLESFQVVN
ncbi:hypothetical protein [Oceanobacillus damuensis]|uniref:hypothetical protein n=1 Tax=Oceanobacillus damuensis TaxID=937928 RepID=UPI00082F67E0|nr:hypothetical protein [Oceanobacillus damuensis]